MATCLSRSLLLTGVSKSSCSRPFAARLASCVNAWSPRSRRLEAVRTGDSDALINGLLRATGRASLDEGTGKVEFAPSLAVGDTWMLTALWRELGFEDSFRRVLRDRRQFDAERLLRVMVVTAR